MEEKNISFPILLLVRHGYTQKHSPTEGTTWLESWTARFLRPTRPSLFLNSSKTEASIHVTILYRHASQEFDNCASTEEQPKIIKEYIFVISDDIAHDSYSVQHVRHIIHNYLVNTVGCRVKRRHEFIDGCSAQYKSRHCMGSHVLLSFNDFGYPA